MHAAPVTELVSALAARMKESREALSRRWLERIKQRVNIDENQVFPTEELLDHIPILITGIANYLDDPADEISADVPVLDKAFELGGLRYSQGFPAHQILKEYEILGGVLFDFLGASAEEIGARCGQSELFACAHRLFRAVAVIQQATTLHYLRQADRRVHEREERLRGFNRMVSHELKNRLGAVLGAGQLLHEGVDQEGRDRLASMVVENAQGMQALIENLSALSQLDGDARRQRNILLSQAVFEAVRQLREMARARGVQLRVAEGMPEVEVNAAAVELCLSNYISNAIKYRDPGKSEQWVEVRGRLRDGASGGELLVEVHDNGIGVDEKAAGRLFERFFRAHHQSKPEIEGTGVGLSLVRETVETLGGRANARSELGVGSVFAISLPCRRDADRGSDASVRPVEFASSVSRG
ncbi:MAG: ATP-binding protein [Longimicrobiaceae bacterium]